MILVAPSLRQQKGERHKSTEPGRRSDEMQRVGRHVDVADISDA